MGWFGDDNVEEETPQESEEEIEEEEADDEEYSINIECQNCNDELGEYIPKGTTVKDYCKDKICEECGCKLVQKE